MKGRRVMTGAEIAGFDRREQCYFTGYREAKEQPEDIAQSRALLCKYPDEYLQGRKDAMFHNKRQD